MHARTLTDIGNKIGNIKPSAPILKNMEPIHSAGITAMDPYKRSDASSGKEQCWRQSRYSGHLIRRKYDCGVKIQTKKYMNSMKEKNDPQGLAIATRKAK
ncbi:MAG: hypothetical protein LBU32_23060 [Clostridiales bacterium]|nr:hypothetical protein [Clostridiales bacterium]